MVKVGDLVILKNDEPQMQNVVIVENIDGVWLECIYVCEHVDFMNPVGRIDRARRVSDFGVALEINKGFLGCKVTGKNLVTTDDGFERPWVIRETGFNEVKDNLVLPVRMAIQQQPTIASLELVSDGGH